MGQQYLSTDPNAGQPASPAAYLSNDATAGTAAPVAPVPMGKATHIGPVFPDPNAQSPFALPPDKLSGYMNKPVARPTGNATIDSLFTPANIALAAAMGIKPATELFLKAIPALADTSGAAIVAKVLKFTSSPVKATLKAAASALGDELLARIKTAPEAAPQTEAPVAAPAPAAAVEAAPAASLPSGEPGPLVNGKSPQQLLNEEAIARRRAEYLARGNKPVIVPNPAPTEIPKLSAQETKVFLAQIQQGVPGPKAMQAILTQRALLAQMPGAMSPADVAAEIAARVGNRSPTR